MKRHIPGLHREGQNRAEILEGLFLVRVERAFYRWHPQKPFFALRLAILEPKEHTGQTISGRLYCTPKALWKLNWFLRDFAYDPDLFGRDEVDEKSPARSSWGDQDFPHHAEWPILRQLGRICPSRRVGRTVCDYRGEQR